MEKKFTLDQMLQDINTTTKVAAEGGMSEEEKKKEEEAKKKKEEEAKKKEEEKKAATEKAASEENASTEESPMDEITKIASQMADIEKDALIKEAQLIGKAIIDGAIARTQEYEKIAQKQTTLTMQEKAAHLYSTDASFKETVDKAYAEKIAEQEKVAQAQVAEQEKLAAQEEKIASEIKNDPELLKAFQAGYRNKVAEIQKAAEQEIQNNPELKAAYEKQASETIKVAQSYQDLGYVKTANALAKVFANK